MARITEFVFKISFFLVFLHSLVFYLLWNVRLGILQALCVVLFVIYKVADKSININIAKKDLLISVCFFVSLMFWNGALDGLTKFLGAVAYTVLVLLLLALDDRTKVSIFYFIYRGMSIILLPSIVVFLLVLLGVGMPNLGLTVHPEHDFYYYFNYVFVLIGTYGFRFNAVFCEPGHLGMIAAFLLFVDNYNFKKPSSIILLISLIMTLSLAGYLLFFIGFFFRLVTKRPRVAFLGFFTLALVSLGVISMAKYINRGNNVVYELIVERLEYDEESGSLAGDNRVSYTTDNFFNNMSISELWFGINSADFKLLLEEEIIAGAGYKMFVIVNGIFGIIGMFFIYLIFTSYSKYKKPSYLFLLLYAISFIQRATVFWTSALFIFILAQSVFNFTRDKIVVDNKIDKL